MRPRSDASDRSSLFSASVWRFCLPALILAVPIIVYWPALQAGFISDDFFWFSYYIKSPAELLEKIMLQHRGEIELEYFRPSLLASLRLDYALWGEDAVGFHLTSILLHSLNSVLLFYLARILGIDALSSATASLLFALYPASTDAVTWIASRSDPLALAWLLIALLFWCAARLRADGRWAVPSVIAYIIAVFAKEWAVAGILLLPIVDWVLRPRSPRMKSGIAPWHPIGYLAFLAVAVGVIAVRYWLFGDIGGHRGEANVSGYFTIGLTSLWSTVVLHDLKIFFTPVNRILWPEWAAGWRIALVATGVCSGLMLLSGLGLAIRTARRDRARFICFAAAILWIIVMFLPIATLRPVTDSLVRSRYLYAASAGLALWAGMSLGLLWRSGVLLPTIGVIVLAGMIAMSVFTIRRHNELWIESGRIARQIHATMAAHSSDLTDGSSVFMVNFPWAYRDTPCAPAMYGNYIDFRYGTKGVGVYAVYKRPDELDEWWEELRSRWRIRSDGFFWDESTDSVRVLPPIMPETNEREAVEDENIVPTSPSAE